MAKKIKKDTKEEPEKKDIIENFGDADVGGGGELDGWAGISKTSLTKMGFCTGLGRGAATGAVSRATGKKNSMFMPNREQMAGEFSKFNPIWMVFPVLNLIIQILKIVFDVWVWLFELIFFKTYEIMIPSGFDFGLKAGKKYCFNLMTFRMLITFLCPPAGVFMAYGIRGFVQIGICAVLSLMFYVPGLIYGIIVILRSDVAEHIEQVELDICTDDGDTSLFSSNEDEKPKCAAKVGETCTVKGAPRGGDAMKLNCCVQPKYKNGAWYWGDSDEIATGPDGSPITSFAQGELKCKDDFHTKLSEKNICVYKSTGGPGMVGF